MEAIDEFTEKIKRIQRKIEETAAAVDEVDTMMTAPGIAAYSGLMIHGEIGEVGRFDRANEVVSYAGLDLVVRESATRGLKGASARKETETCGGFWCSVRGLQLTTRRIRISASSIGGFERNGTRSRK